MCSQFQFFTTLELLHCYFAGQLAVNIPLEADTVMKWSDMRLKLRKRLSVAVALAILASIQRATKLQHN